MTRGVIAALVAVLGVLGCGGSDPGAPTVLAAGASCEADHQCATGHCDAGYCCAAGRCCQTASECPDEFRAAATCTDGGSTTDCQGTRRDATCEGYTCGTRVVEDDSGCAGAVRDCGGYRSVACGAAPVQPPPACATACDGPEDCDTGFTCPQGACIPQAGTGEACTGTGQGTCHGGLKCQNGVCCAAGSATCCTTPNQVAQCGTCMRCGTDYRCAPTPANQRDTRCPQGTCRPGTCNGNGACLVGGTCSGGLCGSTTCQSDGTCGCRCTMTGPNGTTIYGCPGETILYPCSTGPTTTGYLRFRCSDGCSPYPEDTTCH